jgi:hypothetical protein
MRPHAGLNCSGICPDRLAKREQSCGPGSETRLLFLACASGAFEGDHVANDDGFNLRVRDAAWPV